MGVYTILTVHGLEAFTVPSVGAMVRTPAEWVIHDGRALPSDKVTVVKVPEVAQESAEHYRIAGVAV